MKLRILRTGRATTYYVAESYRKENGAVSTRTIERLGTEEELKKKLGADADVEKWCREHVAMLTKQKRSHALPRTAQVTSPAGKRYEQGQARIFNAGWIILQRALYSAGFGPLAKEAIEKASCHDKGELLEILIRCVCEKALSLGARGRASPFLGMKHSGTGSIAGSLSQAVLCASDLATAFASGLIGSKHVSRQSLVCDAIDDDGCTMRVWRDGLGVPLSCELEGGAALSDEALSDLAKAYAGNDARLEAISGDGRTPSMGSLSPRFLSVRAEPVTDLQKKIRKWASDPDAPWRDLASGSLKTAIPPYPSTGGGPICHSEHLDDGSGRMVAVFDPLLREAQLRHRARGAVADYEYSSSKEARYDGYVAASTDEFEEALSNQECAQLVISRIEDQALYRQDTPLCPLCTKISSAYTPSEKSSFAASVGYLADLALSITAGEASRALDRKVSRTEAAAALRAMDATMVGNCVSGIFERTALTDAIESSSRIFLDSELITLPEMDRFLEISRTEGKA